MVKDRRYIDGANKTSSEIRHLTLKGNNFVCRFCAIESRVIDFSFQIDF